MDNFGTPVKIPDENLRSLFNRVRSQSRLGDNIDPEVAMRNNFDKFIIDLKENFSKSKFRKCIDDIRDKESLFQDAGEKWKIIEIKLKSLMKIINKKFRKYSGTNSIKLKGIEEWLRKSDEGINKLCETLLNFYESDEDYAPQLETIIRLVLEQNYYLALYARSEKQIADCAGFLALGERLLKFSADFTSDPDSLNISAKILLFISSLMIADKDFDTAKSYAANSLRVSYRELNFRFDTEEGININSGLNSNSYLNESIEKTFINIIIAFYQMGVCEENMGNITPAIEAYKQSKWFSNTFIKTSQPDLAQFINAVEKRAINYHYLIINIKNNQHTFRDYKQKENKNHFNRIFYDELDTLKKFDGTVKGIEKLKLDDFEDVDINDKKSQNIKHILSTVKVINHFMSDKFRGIIKSMDKIEVSKFDKENKEKIQKKLNEIKADQIYHLKEMVRKSTMFCKENVKNSMKGINLNTSDVAGFHNIKTEPNTNYFLTESNNYINNKLSHSSVRTPSGNGNGNGNGKLNSFNSCNTTKNKTAVKFFPKNKGEQIEKYNYSEYIFDKKFRSKINYLDKLSEREYDFQKKMLILKRNDKLIVDDFDQRKVLDNCETFFTTVLMNKTKILKDDENLNKKKELLNEDMLRKEKKVEMLETKALKSLSTKAFEEFRKYKDALSKPSYKKKKENIDYVLIDKNVIQQKNKDHFNKTVIQLDNLNKLEDFLKRNMHSTSEQKSGMKKSFYNIRSNTDNFIKKNI